MLRKLLGLMFLCSTTSMLVSKDPPEPIIEEVPNLTFVGNPDDYTIIGDATNGAICGAKGECIQRLKCYRAFCKDATPMIDGQPAGPPVLKCQGVSRVSINTHSHCNSTNIAAGNNCKQFVTYPCAKVNVYPTESCVTDSGNEPEIKTLYVKEAC